MKYGLLPGCQNSSGCGRDYSQQWASLGKENLPSTPTLLKIDQLYLSQYLQGSMHYFTQISVSPRRVRVSQDMLLDRYWCCVIHSTVCTVLRCPRTTTWNLLLDFPSHPFWAAWAPCILQCVSWRRLKKQVLLSFLSSGKPVKVTQLCLTLCGPVDYTYTVHGILQARIVEWVAFPFSRGSSQPRERTQVSRIAGGFFTSWATRENIHQIKLGCQPLWLVLTALYSSFIPFLGELCWISPSWLRWLSVLVCLYVGRWQRMWTLTGTCTRRLPCTRPATWTWSAGLLQTTAGFLGNAVASPFGFVCVP